MYNHGLVSVAAISLNQISIGDPFENARNIWEKINEISQTNKGNKTDIKIAVFPELALTGYTCGDLFTQSILIDTCLEALNSIIEQTNNPYMPICFIGLPIRKDNQLFNCAAVIHKGELLALIPKTFLPNYSEFYEMRYFSSSDKLLNHIFHFFDKEVPIGTDILIKDKTTGLLIGTDICEDLWVPIPPSRYHCLHGANVIVNLSASNETIGKSQYRRDLIKMHSATCICGYIYTSASKDESVADTIFSGHKLIAKNGKIIKENHFPDDEEMIIEQIDLEEIMNDRTKSTSFMQILDKKEYITITTETNSYQNHFKLLTPVPLLPFVPNNIDERAQDILNIQSHALANKLKGISCKKVILGVSGGLDSTLALIAIMEAFKINNYDFSGIIGVTMPGFGTSTRTLDNALNIMNCFGITSKTIDITSACQLHFSDINHDSNVHDITYENVQARERTQVLMDLANQEKALVIGTGDLSELALGWCTYNGDHMSMYAINASIPKTLVRSLVNSYAKTQPHIIKEILLNICDTPISPELLPLSDSGEIIQKTEESIGSYNIHDFILYYMLRYGFSPSKIFDLYINSLENKNKNVRFEIIENFKIFYTRFFSQQFKRNCFPDGIKIGSVSFSPRADWRMPSDAAANLWLQDINILNYK